MAEESVVAELAIKLGLVPDKESFEQGEKLFEKLEKGLEFFAGFEAIKSLGELVEHTMEAAIASKHLAERLNMSIESVQGLGYAADVSGASTEDMRVSLQHLALAAEHAKKTGTGPLVDGLGKLHIGFGEFSKANPEDRIMMLSKAFAEAGPNVDKTAIAMEVLGARTGTRLLPLLNKGPEAIRELTGEFKELGAETSGETAEAMEKLEESQKRLKYAWAGLKETAVMHLVPALKEMTDGLLAWFKANREVITSTLQGVMEALVTIFQSLGFVINNTVVPGLRFLAEHADVARALMGALGIVIGAVAAKAFIAWIALAGPFVPFIALLTSFIYLFEKLGMVLGTLAVVATAAWTLMGGGLISLAVIMEGVGLKATAMWIATYGPIGIVIAAIALVGYTIWKYSDVIWSALQKIGSFFSDLGKTVSKAWDDMWDYLGKAWDRFAEKHPWIAGGVRGISAIFGSATGTLGNEGKDKIFSDGNGAQTPAAMMRALDQPELRRGKTEVTNHTNLEFNIHPSQGMKEEDLAELVAGHVGEALELQNRATHAALGGQ